MQRYVIGILIGAAALVWGATNWTAHQAADWSARPAGNDGRDVIVEARGGGTQGKRLQYRVDWEGGKSYGPLQPSTVFRHHYDTPGDKKIRLEAYDPRWGTSHTVEHKVTVK